MQTDFSSPSVRDYITALSSRGRYHFGLKEAQQALGVSEAAAKMALNRLAAQKRIATPARGFYVIIPPEYSRLGCLPADQFIPALMERLGLSYYAGLLSAAQYHGAAHHRPQEFQVMLGKARRSIHCGQVRVVFVVRKRLQDVPVQSFNTPRGTVRVSTPEATAVDLIGYHGHAGGLDQVATVLSELAERIDAEKLALAVAAAPIPWVQRLGYLLELVDATALADVLKSWLQGRVHQTAPLLTGAPAKGAPRDTAWKLLINADVEAEL